MGEVVPMEPEKGSETMQGEVKAVMQEHADNPEAMKQMHGAVMDEAKRQQLMAKQKENREKAHADVKAFMENSGINAALASYAPANDNSVLHNHPVLATETPVELSEQDFQTFFGANGKIRRVSINDAVHQARDAAVLLKGPDGRIYTLYLRREGEDEFYPVHYMVGNQYEKDSAEAETEVKKKRGWLSRLFGKAA